AFHGAEYTLDYISVVSEFVFGTLNAAFVQVMYEQYLRDPTSVDEEWRNLFDNGKLAELPVIPTNRQDVLREEGSGKGEESRVPTPTLPSSPIPLPPVLTPLTGPAPRPVSARAVRWSWRGGTAAAPWSFR